MTQGKLIVLTGPSGVGKGTLVRSLLAQYPQLALSISVTTRSPRVGEIDGKDYYFKNRAEFEQMVVDGELLEWAEFAGNYYGTPKIPVMEKLDQGNSILLEIELQGARQVQQNFPTALRVFILPPSMAELENRLNFRGQDQPEVIARRLAIAQEEIAAASEFAYQVINDDLAETLKELENILFLKSV